MNQFLQYSVYIVGFGIWLFVFIDWYITMFKASKIVIKDEHDLMERYVHYLLLKEKRQNEKRAKAKTTKRN